MQHPILNNNLTSSLSELSSSLNFAVKGDDRHLTLLYRKIAELERQMVEVQTQKVLDETQLPKEVLEQNNLLPHPPNKLKRGKGYRPLLKSEIEEANKHSLFASGQARWLGVAIPTYKKYAQLYGLYEPKRNAKGQRHMVDPNRGQYPLNGILEGKFPNVSDWTVKDKLIRSGVFPARCAICGYDKRRIMDHKICLLLDHKDGDKHNFKRENLQLLCLNCTFECGRGYIRRGNHMFDPDWIQGARIDEVSDKARW